jgi:hypothetical protein
LSDSDQLNPKLAYVDFFPHFPCDIQKGVDNTRVIEFMASLALRRDGLVFILK